MHPLSVVRAWLATSVLAGAGVASADDCAFNKETYAEYKRTCQQADGCAYDAQMKKIMTDSCGPNAAPSTPARKPAASPAAADSADGDSAAEGGAPDGGGVPKISVKPNPTAGTSLTKDVSHEGKWCTYFNGRPSVESDSGTTRMNWYSKGAKVCHGKWQYVCGDDMKWKIHSWCPANGKQSEAYEEGL